MDAFALNRFALALVGITVAQSVGAAPVKATYAILTKGKPTGQATMEQELLPDGGKTLSLIMTIRQGEDRVVVKSKTTYGPDGSVAHEEQRIFPFGMPAVKEIVADFDAAGAKVVTKQKKSETQTVPRQSDWPVANPAAFWFLKGDPDVGATITSYVLNVDSLKWEKSTFTYEGKTHKGRLLRMEKPGRSVETAFAPDGLPETIVDSGGLEMDRI